MRFVIAVAMAMVVGGWFVTAVHAASATYIYDKLGRLIQVTTDNGTVITYTYDAAGNRSAMKVSCGASGC